MFYLFHCGSFYSEGKGTFSPSRCNSYESNKGGIMRQGFMFLFGSLVIGTVIGGLIGEAIALSAGHHSHALAQGMLIGAALGLMSGVVGAIIFWAEGH
jgi:hypothetical protein